MNDTVDKWHIPNLGKSNQSPMLQHEIEQEKKRGFEQGLAQGQQEAKAQFDAKLQMLEQMLTQMKSVESQFEADCLQIIQDYCKSVVEKLVGQSLSQSPETLVHLIEQGVKQLGSAKLYQVKVHPDIIESLGSQLNSLLENKPFEIQTNPALSCLEVQVSTDTMTIKCNLQQSIEQAFNQTVSSEPTAPEASADDS